MITLEQAVESYEKYGITTTMDADEHKIIQQYGEEIRESEE